MTEAEKTKHLFRVADQPNRKETVFEVKPEADHLKALIDELELLGLKKVLFRGELNPQGKRDWKLTGHLGATVVQACAVTLGPVTTRIEESVERTYLADPSAFSPEGEEVEMPEDDTVEPLPAVIDIHGVLLEALSLALPLYPRAEGAEFGQRDLAPPGAEPLTEETARPFAGLAQLVQNKGPAAGEDDSGETT